MGGVLIEGFGWSGKSDIVKFGKEEINGYHFSC
jgi:hypothetical protein